MKSKFIIGLFFLLSCSVNNTDTKIVSKTEFMKFVDEIPILKTNFSLECSQTINHIDIKSDYVPEDAGVVGRLKTKEDYSFIIYSYPADIRLPILEVYNRDGKKIDELPLFEMSDCSIDSPSTSSRFRIQNDETILIEKIKPENGAVYNTISVNLNEIIKKAKP